MNRLTIKKFLKLKVIPFLLEADGLTKGKMQEAIGACIDDIKELDSLISHSDLNFPQAQYIDNLAELLAAIGVFMSEGKFDDTLLESKVYDRDCGLFLKGFFRPIIAQIKNEFRKNSLKEKIENF